METPTYQQRLARVLRHIEQHLDARPDLEELARIACFSPFHFHRIFTSMVGESVAAYVRRLLLERAAMQLGHSREQITRIALHAGYESLDAFSRAFKAHFSLLPSEYRRCGGHLKQARARMPHRPLFYHELPGRSLQDVRIKRFSPALVAAVRHTGPYDESRPAWERLFAALGESGLLAQAPVVYGVSYDNPDITEAGKCRMDACVALPPELDEKSPELRPLLRHTDVFLWHVGNAGEYAVLCVRGPYDLLHPAYRSLFGLWFPQSGREPADDPGFEIYCNSPRTTPPEDLLTKICMPLAPLV